MAILDPFGQAYGGKVAPTDDWLDKDPMPAEYRELRDAACAARDAGDEAEYGRLSALCIAAFERLFHHKCGPPNRYTYDPELKRLIALEGQDVGNPSFSREGAVRKSGKIKRRKGRY